MTVSGQLGIFRLRDQGDTLLTLVKEAGVKPMK